MAPSYKHAKRNVCISRIYITSYCLLIVLCIAWEWWLMPLRPGGSWLVLKVLPLLIGLRGIFQRKIYSLQWISMLLLLYIAEGSLYLGADTLLSASLGGLELILATTCFLSIILYLRPLKKAASQKRLQKMTSIQISPPSK